MNREDLRPAKITAFYHGVEAITFTKEKDGYFHRWADDAFTIDDTTFYQRTVGIVETTTGDIYKVPPEAITLFPVKTSLERLQETSVNFLKNQNK